MNPTRLRALAAALALGPGLLTLGALGIKRLHARRDEKAAR